MLWALKQTKIKRGKFVNTHSIFFPALQSNKRRLLKHDSIEFTFHVSCTLTHIAPDIDERLALVL